MIGRRIKQLREKNDLTQEELAKIVHLSQQSIDHYEKGRAKPSLETLQAFADYFNCSVDYLLCRTDTKKSTPTDEVDEILETLHKRPEMKTLFSITKKATKEDIEKTMKIIEALKDR